MLKGGHTVTRPAALLIAAGLMVAGCGNGGDTATPTTAATATTAPPAATTTAPPAAPTTGGQGGADPAATERAKAATLQLSDFPDGWELHDPTQGLDLEIVWGDVLRCLNAPHSQPAGTATSPTFLRGLATQAQATVEYMSQPAANAVATALSNPRFAQCATDAFTEDAKRNAPEGATPGPVTVAPLELSQLGQRMSATRATFDMNLGELPIPITQDLVVISVGDTVIRLMFLNPGSPFPEDLQRTLIQKVFDRA
jgi:hypothetical protein